MSGIIADLGTKCERREFLGRGYDPGMTKRVTVSLPDDIAAYLDREENASAAVADALRARMDRGAATAAMLRAVGIEVAEEGRARGVLPPLTAEQRAENKRRRDMLRAGTWPTDDTTAA
jgi:Arc/MetJ-type ribon-helix-helix transcriptional regulator